MKIYNTLSGRKEEFAPADGKTVKMYVCGVTPYAPAHVGHAMSYTFFDAVRRYLEFLGYSVVHVQNFTDIDDKIIERAARAEVDPAKLAERYIAEFYDEMDSLNIRRASLYPRATEELPTIVDMIQGLIDKGYAYPANGDVYFRVRKKDGYGSLARRTLEGMLAGARIEPSSHKEHPMDFALWKGAKKGEPEWPSPWGPGRPGWHIECSAMCHHHLGETIDIHGGGQDLIFPHHENEIAQSESYTGAKPFVRFWMHNGLVQLGEEKMSKSLGILVTVKDALQKFSPDALRLFFLSSYYRSPLKFSEESVEAAERGAQRLRSAASIEGQGTGPDLDSDPYRRRFVEAMDDDFNTPQAIAALFDLARQVNRAFDEGRRFDEAQSTLRELAEVLGLTLRGLESGTQADIAPFVDLLVEMRGELRKAKQFELADSIRARLQALGVTVEDTAQGGRWRKG